MYRLALHGGVMSDTAIEARPARPKANEWGERIAAQQRSGMSVKQFCREQGLTEYSFYAWRKRLREQGPVRFALVERSARQQERTAEVALGRLFRLFHSGRRSLRSDWGNGIGGFIAVIQDFAAAASSIPT